MFDVKAIYQQPFEEVDISRGPAALPAPDRSARTDRLGEGLRRRPEAWTATDIFEERELSRDGVVVVVRPDQYVAAVLPLDATDELADFFAQSMLAQRTAVGVR